MIQYLDEWLIVLIVQSVALMSPGPDFVMAVRNSVVHSRQAGIFTAIGFSAGAFVHTTYCIIGIAAVISQSVLLFSIIKYIGAAYLIYIGGKSLLSRGFQSDVSFKGEKAKHSMSDFQAFRSGFITNLFNPKATMFFLALFTQIIDPSTPLWVQLVYVATCVITTIMWFSFVAFVLTDRRVKNTFLSFSKWIDRLCGGLLVALGVKLALSKTV